jgi:hypothetical protein
MKSMEIEEWRPVKGHQGYFVSSLGRVKGRSGKILKTWGVADKRNYPTFGAHVGPGRHDQKKILVHIAVCEAWHGDRPDGMEAAHLNGRPEDCRAVNLAWVLPKENNEQKVLHGTWTFGGKSHKAKLSEDQVTIIREKIKNGETDIQIAGQFGVSRCTIYDIRKGHTWSGIYGAGSGRKKRFVRKNL